MSPRPTDAEILTPAYVTLTGIRTYPRRDQADQLKPRRTMSCIRRAEHTSHRSMWEISLAIRSGLRNKSAWTSQCAQVEGRVAEPTLMTVHKAQSIGLVGRLVWMCIEVGSLRETRYLVLSIQGDSPRYTQLPASTWTRPATCSCSPA